MQSFNAENRFGKDLTRNSKALGRDNPVHSFGAGGGGEGPRDEEVAAEG